MSSKSTSEDFNMLYMAVWKLRRQAKYTNQTADDAKLIMQFTSLWRKEKAYALGLGSLNPYPSLNTNGEGTGFQTNQL